MALVQKSIVFIALTLLVNCSHFQNPYFTREKSQLYLQVSADHLNSGQLTRALESAQKAIELDDTYEVAYNQLALVYMEMKRNDKAEEAFRKALSLRKNYPEALNNLGVLLNREEKFEAAVPYFKKSLEDETYMTPENAYTNMGYAYFRLGDLKAAKKYQQKALEIAPDFCLANKNLADVFAYEKNYLRAISYYESAMQHCPLYQECHYRLGLAFIKTGKKIQARQQLQALIERHRSGPFVERSNEVLRNLQ